MATEYGDVKTLLFTPAGGWNTSVDSDGELHTEHVIPDDYIFAWAELPPYPTELKQKMDCPSLESEEW